MNDTVADILAQSLEAIERDEVTLDECLEIYPEYRQELAELLETALIIQHVPRVLPRPGFRAATRMRVLSAVAVRQPLPFRSRILHFWQYTILRVISRPSLALALVATLVFAFVGVGSVYAAGSALPGDVLYPLKTTLEDVQLQLTDQKGDVDLYLQFVRERLREINLLTAEGRFDGIPVSVQRFESQTEAAALLISSLEPDEADQVLDQVVLLEQDLSQDIGVLYILYDSAPTQAKSAIWHALQVSNRGHNRLRQLFSGRFPPGPPGDLGPPGEVPPGPPGDKPAGPPEGVPPGKDDSPPERKPPVKDVPKGPPEGVSPGPPGGAPPGQSDQDTPSAKATKIPPGKPDKSEEKPGKKR